MKRVRMMKEQRGRIENRKKERKTKGSLEGPFREDVCVVLVCERDVVCIYIYI